MEEEVEEATAARGANRGLRRLAPGRLPRSGLWPGAWYSDAFSSRLEVAGVLAGRQPRDMFGETCWPY